MANHSRRRQKFPPNAPHDALRFAPSSSHNGWQPPELADTIFKGLRGCMALITLRCNGDASSSEQTRWGSYTPSTPLTLYPIFWGIVTHAFERGTMPCVGCGGNGCDLWWCFVACRSTNNFFPLNYGIVGIARKLLSRARWFLHCTEAETQR